MASRYRPSYHETQRPPESRIVELVEYYEGRCVTCGERGCSKHARARRIERFELTPALIRERFVELVRRGLDVERISKAMRQLDPAGAWRADKCRRLMHGVKR